MRNMKRRQFGAMLAAATFSLGGVGSAAADASAQETDPLQIADVSVSLGGITASIGRATFAFDEGTMLLRATDWSTEVAGEPMSIGEARVAVDGADAETFATVRAAMVEAFESRSASSLVSALADANVSEDAGVRTFLGSVETGGQLVADEIAATGTVGSVVPSGSGELLQDGASLSEVTALGASEWSRLTIQLGDTELAANDVVMQRDGTALHSVRPAGARPSRAEHSTSRRWR
ncbi:hypothetical protein [Halorussus caseinilyticus]|uniref:Uncharacterized protein n=1 Tax=Halorussus caseinilyticus TaxID=3034025 RepID=A0ABD5WSC6_9EURY